jgi:hypothetical protein
MALYGFRPRAFAHFERSKARSAKIEKLGLAPSHSSNFCASLHQERFTKWSKRHSFGSHKSFPATWITEHYSENHYRPIFEIGYRAMHSMAPLLFRTHVLLLALISLKPCLSSHKGQA